MAGSELRTYDIPNRLAEQLPQETGIRTSSLRGIGFGPNKFATRPSSTRSRRSTASIRSSCDCSF